MSSKTLSLAIFECITGIVMDGAELCLKNFCNQRFEQDLQEKVQKVFYTLQENEAVHNPYSQELLQQNLPEEQFKYLK